MQNDPNNRPYYYNPPRVAGRLIGQKPSNIGLVTLFKQQSRGIQIGIISIGVLMIILLLLVPFALFSSQFANTPSDQTAQTATDPNQNNTVPTSAVLATTIATTAATTTNTAADTTAALANNTPTPMPITSQVTPPVLALDKGATSNPWGYDFNAGSFITAPPAAFCTYFSCVNGFWNGQGYVEECQDGTYTLGGGVGGDCDGHSGDLRPLYYHPALIAPTPTPTPAPAATPTPTVKTTPTPDPKATPTPKPKKPKATPTPTH